MTKPNLNFVDVDIDQLEADAKKIIEETLGYTIAPANPIWLLVKSLLAFIYQLLLLLNFCAKMNLLAFASGAYLDALGTLVGVERIPATAAQTSVQINLSAARLVPTTINQGTRITADNQTFFSLDEEVVFLPGETQKTSTATCLTLGEIGNGFAPGELNQIVDPQPFLQSIVNITTSDGGADLEDDESLRERIHIAPESFSCAGPVGAYVARAKEVSSLISDVAVSSSAPGHVDIYILTDDGQPSDQLINMVEEHLSAKTIRPLNDIVEVHAPVQTTYSIDVQCFISNDDSAQASQIISKAESAVEEFIAWQKSKLGRDLNPSKLMGLLMNAGCKRVVVNSPAFTVVNDISVATCSSHQLSFHYEDE